jgi:hypothetical protein
MKGKKVSNLEKDLSEIPKFTREMGISEADWRN